MTLDIADQLLLAVKAAAPVEPFAFALALGFSLCPEIGGPARVADTQLHYDATRDLPTQQRAIAGAIAEWALLRAGLSADEGSIEKLCARLRADAATTAAELHA